LPYEITQCYLPPDTSEHARLNLPTMEGRTEGWGTYRDGLPVSGQSPIQVVTGPDVQQLS